MAPYRGCHQPVRCVLARWSRPSPPCRCVQGGPVRLQGIVRCHGEIAWRIQCNKWFTYKKCGSLSCCPADGKMLFFWNMVSRLDVSRLDVSDVNNSWVALNFTPNYQHVFYLQYDMPPKSMSTAEYETETNWRLFWGRKVGPYHFYHSVEDFTFEIPDVFARNLQQLLRAMTSSSGYAQSQLVMQLKFVVFLGVTVLSSHSVPCMLLTIFHPSLLAELIMEKSDRGSYYKL